MEPPTKKPRLSRPDSPDSGANRPDHQIPTKPSLVDKLGEQITVAKPRPTRTLDLSSFRRRSLEQRGAPPRGNAGGYLFPRAPDVTVTANVVNIAIMDGADRTSTTEMPVPTADTIIAISDLGSLTVTGGVGSLISSVTQGPSPTGSSGSSLTDTLVSSTLSANSTSGDHTVTVTSTSILSIKFNGTAFRTSTITSSGSHSLATFVTDGTTVTTDSGDSSSTDYTSSYVFGDLPASATVQATSDGSANGVAATSTTSSSSAATPTSSGSGGGVVLTPQQQQVVGGVVGGVAGVALVLIALLYLLKWYRRHLKAQGRLPEQNAQHRQLTSADDYEYHPSGAMSRISRSSIQPIATFKQTLQKFRPNSLLTLTSNSTERSSFPGADSEKSFQRVSGRKIPSVLLTGGDGYGNPGLASPPSDYSTYSRSRDASQTSSFRDSNNSASPFLPPGFASANSGYSTPTRHQSPFRDPSGEGLGNIGLSIASTTTDARDFASTDNSRSQLNLHAGGLAALNPIRRSDTNVMFRPSPARTPTTTSPSSSSLMLPMNTPPLMSGDIPAVPPLHPMPNHTNSRKISESGVSVQRSMGPRSVSGISARSSSSVGGRFTENI